MFEEIIRTLGQQWGLGTQARTFVQMLLAKISDPRRGGFTGFIQRLRDVGLGSTADAWMRSPKTAPPVSAPDLERAIGDNNLISDMSSRFGIDPPKVAGALGFAVPAIVGLVAKDGVVPTSLPAEVESFIGDRSTWTGTASAKASQAAQAASQKASQAAQAASQKASQAASKVTSASSTHAKKNWWPWIAAAVVALLLLGYCNMQKRGAHDTAAPGTTTAPATSAATSPTTSPGTTSDTTAGTTAGTSSGTSANTTPEPGTTPRFDDNVPDTTARAPETTPGPDATPPATNPPTPGTPPLSGPDMDAPKGAAVVASTIDGVPMLNVFFDVGKTTVSNEFQQKSAALVEYMQAHPNVVAEISGFNDPTGDPQVNARLAKGRAEAVQKKLVAAGVAKDRTRLEKPAETTATAASNAASRRVDVVLR